ncbi:MAG: DUF2244 domain-containing protein [Alphaproteobacteria bacterium]|nr:DUF2244 domain-containing protein [Alphaproteobacteria bacterium]
MKQSNAAIASHEDNQATNESPVFEALLTPHRSLGRNGFVVLICIASVVTIAHGVVFAMAGAWPVAGFFGLDLILLFGAFALNYRAARAREIVSVSRTRLSISKIAPSGQTRDYRFNPFWARFRVSRHDEIGITRMNISGGGRSTDIGGFLNPDDRESFARAFSGALATVRRR